MGKGERGLLYRTMFRMTFYDENWNELPKLAVESRNADVLAIHLRFWRQKQIDRLLENMPQDESIPIAVAACVEITCGGQAES
jgi:hypothetical protein